MPFGPVTGPNDIELHVLSCRRTRAFNVARFDRRPRTSPYASWQAEPPPTFPFLESQCQRAPTKGEFSFCSRWNAARKTRPAKRRGRGLYEGDFPKSNPKKQIFSGPVDR